MTRVSVPGPDIEADVSAEQVAAPTRRAGKTSPSATIDGAREKKSGAPLQGDNA